MCMASAAVVLTVSDDGQTADVLVDGRTQRVLLAVLDEAARPVVGGDWLLVHSGLALSRMDAADAALRASLLERSYGGTS